MSQRAVIATLIATAPNFIYTVQRKDRTVYFTQALNGDRGNFYGQVLGPPSPQPAPLTLTLSDIETTSGRPAQLEALLQAVSLRKSSS